MRIKLNEPIINRLERVKEELARYIIIIDYANSNPNRIPENRRGYSEVVNRAEEIVKGYKLSHIVGDREENSQKINSLKKSLIEVKL